MYNLKNIYINDYFTIVGPLEKAHELKNCNIYLDDYYYGENSIEKAEAKMQKEVLNNLIPNNNPEIIMGGDLTNQLTATGLAVCDQNIPYMGLYSACATSASAFITLGNFIMSKSIKEGLFIISSHNLAAEKQFRFPVEYGAPKPLRSSLTATAAVGMIISNKPGKIKIVNGTLGKVVDSGVKDAHNLGGVMAISAVDTLMSHLKSTKTSVGDYDLILTGDLGKVGSDIFKETLLQIYNIKLKNHLDGGASLYKDFEYSGASGPAVLPLILVTKILENKKYKKILYLATGSLHSPSLVNQKNTIPAVTHAVSLEVL